MLLHQLMAPTKYPKWHNRCMLANTYKMSRTNCNYTDNNIPLVSGLLLCRHEQGIHGLFLKDTSESKILINNCCQSSNYPLRRYPFTVSLSNFVHSRENQEDVYDVQYLANPINNWLIIYRYLLCAIYRWPFQAYWTLLHACIPIVCNPLETRIDNYLVH